MEDNILEKLEEKLRSILSLRIKIDLSQNYEKFEGDFEDRYINIRLDELLQDVDDLISVAEDDIRAEIEMDIEYEQDAQFDEQNNYWS